MGGVELRRPADAVPMDERDWDELGPDEGYIHLDDYEGRWDPHATGIWRGERVPDAASVAKGSVPEAIDWSLALLRRSEHGTVVGAGAAAVESADDVGVMATCMLEGEYEATSSRHGRFTLTQTWNTMGDDPGDPRPAVVFEGNLRIPEGAPRTALGISESGGLPRVAALKGVWRCEADGTAGTFTANLVDPEPDDEPKKKTKLDVWNEAELAYF